MSKTIAAQVHSKSLYISLPSSAKQQREMTKFCVFYGTWTTANVLYSIWNSTHIELKRVSAGLGPRHRGTEQIQAIANFVCKIWRPRLRCLSSRMSHVDRHSVITREEKLPQ